MESTHHEHQHPDLHIIPVKEPVDQIADHVDDEVTSPDPQLLAYQKTKITPKLSLTNITELTEDLVLEVNNMAELDDVTVENCYGLLPAGSEEVIVESLKRQGSLGVEAMKDNDDQI